MKDNYAFKNEIMTVSIIIIVPFLFYAYLIIPNEIDVYETSFITIYAGYYGSVQNFIYILFYKSMIIILLSVWLLTSKENWRFVILIPILFELYKFAGFIFERHNDYDEFNFNYSLKFIFGYLLMISIILFFNKSNLNSDLDLPDEIRLISSQLSSFNKKDLNHIKNKYELLKLNKDKVEKREYLLKLIEFRDKLN